MRQLTKNILELLHTLEHDKDLENARAAYRTKIEPLISGEASLSNSLELALIELNEMLFVHPEFSKPMRDIHASIQIIRDELEDASSSSSS